jgi:hypothetical protein
MLNWGEAAAASEWKQRLRKRLIGGRQIQRVYGNKVSGIRLIIVRKSQQVYGSRSSGKCLCPSHGEICESTFVLDAYSN